VTDLSILKPQRNPEFISQLLPDGYVLLYSERTNWTHTLTPLGGLVWEFCDGKDRAIEIAGTISSVSQVPVKEADVVQLISEFQSKGLLA
jgi:hypothetical protein